MKIIPAVNIPRNFNVAVVSFDGTYDDGFIEFLLINKVGFAHESIIDLDDLPTNSERKFDLVIYIHRTKKNRTISEFLEILNRFKGKFIGVPSLKVNIMEHINKSVIKVRNISQNNNFRDIIESVAGHLGKMYNISFQR